MAETFDRITQFDEDPGFQQIASNLRQKSPTQIKQYANNNLPSLTTPERQLIAQILLVLGRTIDAGS